MMKCTWGYISRCTGMQLTGNTADKIDKNYTLLWKMRTISDKLKNIYLTLDETTVLFIGRVIFKEYIRVPKKHK
jgi:hypothetical protein